MKTPIQEFREMIQDRYDKDKCFEYGELLNWIDNVFIEQEKKVIMEAYLKALIDTNFNDLVGILSCQTKSEKYYTETFDQ